MLSPLLSKFNNMADTDVPQVTDKPKKRQKLGSKFEMEKKNRLSSHETGPDCNCSRHRCFAVTSEDERRQLISLFNGYQTKDQQDAYLSTLIRTAGVKRRRPREISCNNVPNESSYAYCLKASRNGKVEEITVCAKAFASVFGITERRIRTVKQALFTQGCPPTDQRGKHNNRPHKVTEELKDLIFSHISSFRGRMSHYSRHKTRKLYLEAGLNISKMFNYFKEVHPNATVGYDTYRDIFNNNFNIAFGYPRSDTCSKCDRYRCELAPLEKELEDHPDDADLLTKIASITTERQLHHRKAETFYTRKRDAKSRAQSDNTVLAVAFDFQKDLPCPNKTTNDVYYRRQLTLHSFNIHELATDDAYIYSFDERIAKKGANDVVSMLDHYLKEKVANNVEVLELFCDSCGGQNKNYTVIRFLYYLVHIKKRFRSIKVSFPVRGHSYMECDRDLTLVDKKADVEMPSDWANEFRRARTYPRPYNVIELEQDSFNNYSDFLKPSFYASCPFPTRPIRELLIRERFPQTIHFRNNWNSFFDSAVVIRGTKQARAAVSKCAASQPSLLYGSRLAISHAKYLDLQVLKLFCRPENRAFYAGLTQDGQLPGELHEEESESDSDSDCE